MQNPPVLNSWKEVARYVGRGVRTVQRWERNFGFPVRRPNGARRGVVFAISGEIDTWLRRQTGLKDHAPAEAQSVWENRRALHAQSCVLAHTAEEVGERTRLLKERLTKMLVQYGKVKPRRSS